MRIVALTTVALLASASAALAAPASVEVRLSPAMQAKAEKTYGVRDVNEIAADLQRTVERRLAKTGAYDGARIQLTLVDAVPNRPTMKQMFDKPGLSFQSFGIGGAEITGQAIAADGTVTPLGYKWYEQDIREAARAAGPWQDAQWTMQRFADRLGRGDAVARRD